MHCAAERDGRHVRRLSGRGLRGVWCTTGPTYAGGFATATLQRIVLCLRHEQKPCVVGLTVNTLHDSVPPFSAPKLPLAITGLHHAAGV